MYCMTGTGMTWDEAFAYVGRVLEQECAEQGMTVAITDPVLIAQTNQLLRAGKANLDALGVEVRPAPTRRRRSNLQDVELN